MTVLRALLFLFLVAAISIAATLAFGERILVALGFLLVQVKVLAGKLRGLRLSEVAAWVKLHGTGFFRKDLLMKWLTTYAAPLLLGKAIYRRIASLIGQARAAVGQRYSDMMGWYNARGTVERAILALVVLLATLALSVTSLGLWLILFSVKFPLWVIAAFMAALKGLWLNAQKTVFRMVAFLQLGWLWRWVRPWIPARWLRWKRRLDYRIARSVVRRRRMTLQQLAARKDRLPFRLGVMVEWLFQPPGRGR